MSINIQALHSSMLKTEFFAGAMTWAAMANQVLAPDDEKWDEIFEGRGNDEAQRALNKSRIKDALVPYLTESDDAFFSSLTLIMVPMDGSDAKEGKDWSFEPCKEGASIGELKIEDHVQLFTADGQHRRAGIEAATMQAPETAKEQVPVVLVPYKGKSAVRQLFADLNLNAKPVSKTTGYAFDERDPVVLITKRVMRDIPILNGRVNQKTNSLSPRSAEIVTVNTLVKSNVEVLAAIHGCRPIMAALSKVEALKSAKGQSIDSDIIGKLAEPVIAFWQTFLRYTPGWDDLAEGVITAGNVRDGKDDRPGCVSAYGIGWQAAAVAYAGLIKTGMPNPIDALIECLKATNWEKGPHWNGISMVGTRVNNTGPGVRATAGYLLKQGQIPEPSDDDENILRPLFQVLRDSQEEFFRVG